MALKPGQMTLPGGQVFDPYADQNTPVQQQARISAPTPATQGTSTPGGNPNFSEKVTAPATAAATTPATNPAPDLNQYILDTIKRGVSPQQAAQMANQQFGLTTGNEAVYYPGSNTIGLANGYYLAGDPNGSWSAVQRQSGSSSANPQGLASLLGALSNQSLPSASLYTPNPSPLQPSIGATNYGAALPDTSGSGILQQLLASLMR